MIRTCVCICLFLILCLSSVSAKTHADASGTLYGIVTSPKTTLCQVDPTTGNVTLLPTSLEFSYAIVAQQLSTIDTNKGIIYVIGYNMNTGNVGIFGVSVNAATLGNLTVHIQLDMFVESSIVGLGQLIEFDHGKNQILVQGYDSDGKHHLYSVDPSTQTTNEITSFGDGDMLGGLGGVDPTNRLYYTEMTTPSTEIVELFVFNIDTGAQTSQIKNTVNLETMDFDDTNSQFVGIGLATDPDIRTIVTVQSPAGTFNVTNLSDGSYFIIDGQLSVFDPTSRLVFCVMQKGTDGPFFLVGVNADSGEVMDSVPMGDESTQADDMPWILEWMPNSSL